VKILIAGDWHSSIHEEAIFDAFKKLGHEPIRFAWYKYFVSKKRKPLIALMCKFQNKYLTGPLVKRLNNDLIKCVAVEQPDFVFIYRGSHIYPKTLKAMHAVCKNTLIAGYNNDDPFSPFYPKWLWRHFTAAIPEYDFLFAYRQRNINDYEVAGAKHVSLLRSWFIPGVNHPVELTEKEKEQYECDVVFVGHYEDDGRVEYLKAIHNAGYKLKIWGPGYDWDPVLNKIEELKDQVPLSLVWDNDYNKALCGGKIALCFFSTMNRDTYTRRCFEIPATGVLMLSAYSEDLTTMFTPGKEIDIFQSIDDMLDKIKTYSNDTELRNLLASAGHKRVYDDGHDVVSRMTKVIEQININRP
jgi:spore maturation protein CgeB